MTFPHAERNPSGDALAALWNVHRHAAWPDGIGPREGELMMVDTVITGCVTYYFENDDGLDDQRIDILRDCLTELEELLPEIPEPTLDYFLRARELALLLLSRHAS